MLKKVKPLKNNKLEKNNLRVKHFLPDFERELFHKYYSSDIYTSHVNVQVTQALPTVGIH